MNVLFVTGQIRDADFIEHELRKIAPNIHVDVSPKPDDALGRLVVPGRYEAVWIDAALPGSDCQSLITSIREQDLPVAILVLVPPAGEDPPLSLLEAGADDYVVKRPHFIRNLLVLLQRTIDRRRLEAERRIHPLLVLFAGDMTNARHYFASAPLIQIEAAVINPDGSCNLPPTSSGKLPYDAVVIEVSGSEMQSLRIFKDIAARSPEIPTILLVETGSDTLCDQALKMGAAECVAKSGDFVLHLIPAIENAVCRHDLTREKTALRSTEAHLRMLVENIPACVILLTSTGVIQAVNWAGLSLVGATQVEQVVGKSLLPLVGSKHKEKLRVFVAGICAGNKGAIQFELDGLDGVSRRLELKAVPLRRDADSAASVLGVLRDLRHAELEEPADSDAKEKPLETAEEGAPATGRIPSLAELQKEAVEQARILQENRSQLQAEEQSGAGLPEGERQVSDGAYVVLEESVRIIKTAYEKLEEELRTNQRSWELERRKHEEARKALENTARKAEENLALAENRHRSAEDEWRRIRQELDQQQRETEARLKLLEGVSPEISSIPPRPEAQHQNEQSQWEAARRDLEEQNEAAQERLAWLEEENRRLAENHAELGRKFQAEKAEWEKIMHGLSQQHIEDEERRALLEEQLRAFGDNRMTLEKNNRDLAEGHEALENRYRAEKTAWDETRHELEHQGREARERLAQLEESARELSEMLSAYSQQVQAERSGWENSRQEMEQSRQEVEHELALRTEEVRRLEGSRAELEQRYRMEQAQGEQVRHDLEQRYSEAEARRMSLEEAMRRLQESRSEAEEKLLAANTGWEETRRDFQQQISEFEGSLEEERRQVVSLKETMLGMEKRCAELDAICREEEDASSRALNELELLRNEQVMRIAAFEDALREAENRIALLQEQLQAQSAGNGEMRNQLEVRLASLETELQALQTRHEQAGAQARAERAGWEAARQELVGRQESAEMLRVALSSEHQSLQARLAELEETRRTETAVWVNERQELLAKADDLEKKVACLEQSLAAAAASQNRIIDERQQEIAARNELQEDLENQRAVRMALEDALRASETRVAKLTAATSSERADREALTRQLERQQAARVALGKALRAAETRTQSKTGSELSEVAARTLSELIQPLTDCGHLLMECLDDNDPRRLRARRLIEIAKQVDSLAARLMPLALQQQSVDLNAAVTHISGTLVGESVDLITILAPRLPRVLISQAQAERLVTALIGQCSNALPLGGTITVETGSAVAGEEGEAPGVVTLTVTASGALVQAPSGQTGLESAVAACRATLRAEGDPDIGYALEVTLPLEPPPGK